jgi:hypothetical protein
MPSQVAHDAVLYGIAVGASAIEYGKGRPLLRPFIGVVQAPSQAVLTSKVLSLAFPCGRCAQPASAEAF